MQEKLYMEGYFACSVKPMGGRFMLLSCEDKEELKDLVENTTDWLDQWFDEIKPYSPSIVASEGLVWVKCFGVPLNVNGRLFNIVIREEETSNSLFSMKFDHVIFSNSDIDGDDTVSWSLYSDSSDVEARKTIEDEESINCEDFEIPVEIGERVVVGPQEVAWVQDSSKMVKNRYKDQITSTDNSIQHNVDPKLNTCFDGNLDLGFKDGSSKPNSDMVKPTQNPSMGMNLDNNAGNTTIRIHRKQLSETNTADNLKERQL
ncbi:hypothetical protein SLEP1_g58621 [Rubroshorea leprosula]|uniref:DUF4283 domain-containing protein n=1 Tax=Rubroshorea leprosula TaxID=152421 RepID=A0AAV5MTZ4_9ROSI|nr:hypothetical protein SLEP1_g58621 [Rubroshorea leprosula]